MPRKSASENVVCLCHLLNILANFSNLFLHIGKQCGPRGVVGWCEGAVYLTSLGRPTDIGLQLGKARYPCSG